MLGIEPGPAGWEAQTLPLCYAMPTPQFSLAPGCCSRMQPLSAYSKYFEIKDLGIQAHRYPFILESWLLNVNQRYMIVFSVYLPDFLSISNVN